MQPLLDKLKGNVTNANKLIERASASCIPPRELEPSIPYIMLTRLQRLTMTAVDAIKAASTEIGATADAWPTINANASKLRRATYIVNGYRWMIQRQAQVSGHKDRPEIVKVTGIAHEISRNVKKLSTKFSKAFNEEHKTCPPHEQVADLWSISSGSKQVRKIQLDVAEAVEKVAYCASSLGIEARIAVQLLIVATEAEKVARALGEGLTGIATGSLQRLDTALNVANMAADRVRTASNKVLEYADEYILREYVRIRGAKGLHEFIEKVFNSAVIDHPTNASRDYITNAVIKQKARISSLRDGSPQDCINVFATPISAPPSTDAGPSTNAELPADAEEPKDWAIEFAKALSEGSDSWEFRDAFCNLVKEQLEIAKCEAIEMNHKKGSDDIAHHFRNSATFIALVEKSRKIDNTDNIDTSPADALKNFGRQTMRDASDALSSVKMAANAAKDAAKQARKAVNSIIRAKSVIISPLDSRYQPQQQDTKRDEYLEMVLESTKDARQRIQEAFAHAAAYETSDVAEKLKVIINSSQRMNKLMQVS